MKDNKEEQPVKKGELTPMMQQYQAVKKQYPDTLVFYRIGDFYEMFFEDAQIGAHELDLVLTGRHGGMEDRIPMCGVPHHAVNSYIQRLISKGYKVTLVEQMEDPATAVGLVKRDVIRIITPGTAMDDMGDSKATNYLGALTDFNYGYALAVCELTTGETRAITLSHDTFLLKQTILANDIREIVVSSSFDQRQFKGLNEAAVVTVSVCDETETKPEYQPVINGIQDVHLNSAINRLMNYLQITQKRQISHLSPMQLEDSSAYLQMDYATLTNLELVEANRQAGHNITLWSFMDKTRSAAGSRMLKKWIMRPLRQTAAISQRQDMIAYLLANFLVKEQLKNDLSQLYDLDRLIGRIAYGSANGRDILRLRQTLQFSPAVLNAVKTSGIYPEYDSTDQCQDLYARIKDCIVDDPPLTNHDGGIFVDGYSQQLDELRQTQRHGQQWIADLEQSEKEKTGIKNLKIGYNRVFGYYIEISRGQTGLVKEEWGYVRKQTLTTGERYITAQLKEKEDAILHAEQKAVNLEAELFAALIADIKTYLFKLQKLAAVLAQIDAVCSLAEVSNQKGYTRPAFSADGSLLIRKGRHPILEAVSKDPYVPNDVTMNDKRQILIITGPNMGGKSTYMRQTVLIALMAQMGCYVPAAQAVLPVFDQIFTRIGSTDDILTGQSTFMVEMNEANHALQHATKDSLVIFDEIGRGTSTYDGMALAQAMLEYIAAAVGAKTLFSTHYHELTCLADSIAGVCNVSVQVHENNDEITFLYKVKDGSANKSYGIHVASLAHLPAGVISRAKVLVKEFESSRQQHNNQTQMVVVEKTPPELIAVAKTLQQVNPDAITPLEALQLVSNLKKQLPAGEDKK